MEILVYNELHPTRGSEQFKRVCDMLKHGNFAQAEVKKLAPHAYYRAKLNDTDRLLFTFRKCGDETVILLLEIIYNHEYDKSRFLNGAVIDEDKIPTLKTASEIPSSDASPLIYRNARQAYFHLLDRPLSFDDAQEQLYTHRLPVVIIGSAGSGKTVLAIEKMKTLPGEVLYVTRSTYLADNARRLYSSFGYENSKQEITFSSFGELLNEIKAVPGRLGDFSDFLPWYRNQSITGKLDAHQLYEEICGVITGMSVDKPYLTEEDYLNLGVRQSIYLGEERRVAYEVFTSYMAHQKSHNIQMENVLSYEYLSLAKPRFEAMVIDEVQDMTTVQLFLLLKLLKAPHNFLLCGDSNQIVHPNFFSWKAVKSLFYTQKVADDTADIAILHANYRNARRVTEVANQLLRLKVARFGSVDRESNYLVDCVSSQTGMVELIRDNPTVLRDINAKTQLDVTFAVLVLREEDKDAAARVFSTPLVFSVREAKGLEYKNVIIYDLVSDAKREFEEITADLKPEDVAGDLKYARAKDKTDKSLEIYKFFINSLYVALTRAVENIYWIERDTGNRLFRLLNVSEQQSAPHIQAKQSSMDDWRKEAQKLAKQGRVEQAQGILKEVLKIENVPWDVLTREQLMAICKDALDVEKFNRQAKQKLLAFTTHTELDGLLERLKMTGFALAFGTEKERQGTVVSYNAQCGLNNRKAIEKNVAKYGVDYRNLFNQTPLMVACINGDADTAAWLLERGAEPELTDTLGFNAFHHLLHFLYYDGYRRQQAVMRETFDPEENISREMDVEDEQQWVGLMKYRLADFMPLLKQLMPETVTVRVDGRQFKLSSNRTEYMLFQYMYANIQHQMMWGQKREDVFWNIVGFDSASLMLPLSVYPDYIMPEKRRKKASLSANLSKSEMDSTNPYSHKLFWRVERGRYLLNPNLELPYGDSWMHWDEIQLMRFWIFAELNPVMAIFLLKMHEIRTNSVFRRQQNGWDVNWLYMYMMSLNNPELCVCPNRWNRITISERADCKQRVKNLVELLFHLQDGLPRLPRTFEEYDKLCGKKYAPEYSRIMKDIAAEKAYAKKWHQESPEYENSLLESNLFNLMNKTVAFPPLFLENPKLKRPPEAKQFVELRKKIEGEK